MTYLVQKTNMFKQKMKIDDKITGSKMHTEQIQDKYKTAVLGFSVLGLPFQDSWFITFTVL